MNPVIEQKKNAFVTLFRLRWQRENGLMNKYKRQWFPKKPICDAGSHGFQVVGLQEVKPALLFLGIGTGISLLIMIGEIIYCHSIANRMRKRCIASKSDGEKRIIFKRTLNGSNR